jgi:hypothetical protein
MAVQVLDDRADSWRVIGRGLLDTCLWKEDSGEDLIAVEIRQELDEMILVISELSVQSLFGLVISVSHKYQLVYGRVNILNEWVVPLILAVRLLTASGRSNVL